MDKIIFVYSAGVTPELKKLIPDIVASALDAQGGIIEAVTKRDHRQNILRLEVNMLNPCFVQGPGEEASYMRPSSSISLELGFAQNIPERDHRINYVDLSGPPQKVISRGIKGLTKVLERKFNQLHRGARTEALVRAALGASAGRKFLNITLDEAFYSSVNEDLMKKVDCQQIYYDEHRASKKTFKFGIKSSKGGIIEHLRQGYDVDTPQLAVISNPKINESIPYEWIAYAVCLMIILKQLGYVAHVSVSFLPNVEHSKATRTRQVPVISVLSMKPVAKA